jgi:hypothetical protein
MLPETPQGPSPALKAKILQLLREHKTEEALALCEGMGEQYLLLRAQLNAARSQDDSDLIAAEYFEATKSKINDALQELMEQKTVSAPQKPNFIDRIRRFFS